MLQYQKSIILFLVVLVCFSCSDENPIITVTGKGKIFIESNVDEGQIFVDGKFSGLVTPDTLELLAVNHNIKVRKDGYFSEEKELSFKKNKLLVEYFELIENNLKRTVLIENFIFPDCDTCKFPNDEMNNLKMKYGNRVQIINYPNIPSNDNSPLHFDLKNDIKNRLDYYNLINSINFIFDGTYSENINSEVDNRFLKNTIFSITIGDTTAVGNNLTLTVFVDVFDLDGYDFDNLFLISALTENNVQLSDSQNVNFVLRSFINGSEGISLTGINKKGRARFAFNKTLDPSWKKNDLTIICFVQDRLSKEVIQVGSSKISLQ